MLKLRIDIIYFGDSCFLLLQNIKVYRHFVLWHRFCMRFVWLQSALDREELCLSLKNCEGNTTLDFLITVGKNVFELGIEIIDINDNSPIFNPDEKQIEIPEVTVNVSVLQNTY